MTLTTLFPIIPELFLALLAMVLVLWAAFGRIEEKTADTIKRFTLLGLFVTAILVIVYGLRADIVLSGLFATSPFIVYMKILTLVGAFLVLLMAGPHLRVGRIHKPEFSILLILAVLGMMVVISSNDLIVLYMGIELQSFPLYVIAAMQRDNLRSSEAGLKYFLLGGLSSSLLLYGISMIYGFTGSTNYDEVGTVLFLSENISSGVVIGVVFLLAGIAFKISAAPFHMWTPDVYEGTPTIVTAFFAAVPKVAAMTLFLQVTYNMLGPATASWQQVIIAISLASMIIGAFGAVMQSDIKRLIAYSSVAHMGYALVGVASAIPEGVSAVMLYMTIYVVSAIGIFSIILTQSRNGIGISKINDLAGYSRSHPVHAACMMILMFSMAGIPPLGGFFAKWFVFAATVDAGLIWLAIIGVITSVVGAFYYIRIIKVMYVDELADALDATENDSHRLIMIAMTAVIVLMVFALPYLRDASIETLPYIALTAR